uniref:Sec-independent translocase component C n=1 Tax=Timspurckia oligopyrenoides TaxID=708627 RepID=UPI001FCD6A8D|nr:Sec-independent translocase component C [Timspurckia oligopyrenoides]UNJ17568.1 Sec-independent translocase component C [Timspurckia oligopyrenoides]
MNNSHDFDQISGDISMPLSEHLEELRARFFQSILFFITACFIYSSQTKKIVSFLQKLAPNVKFLQLGPGEYFFSSIKVVVYISLLTSLPFVVCQILLFILPGLTNKEKRVIIPLSAFSLLLFFTGLTFAYLVLIPAALNFFISYGSSIVEPLWSLEQYLDFILILLLSTGIAFQVPTIQIILVLLGIANNSTMLSAWKYVLVLSTIAAAILTPSVDPLTQILLSCAIFSLYFIGILFSKFLL